MMALYMYDAVVEILFFALNAVNIVLLPQQLVVTGLLMMIVMTALC